MKEVKIVFLKIQFPFNSGGGKDTYELKLRTSSEAHF